MLREKEKYAAMEEFLSEMTLKEMREPKVVKKPSAGASASGIDIDMTDLLKFMVEECDFDVEHADGSFLDHLYF